MPFRFRQRVSAWSLLQQGEYSQTHCQDARHLRNIAHASGPEGIDDQLTDVNWEEPCIETLAAFELVSYGFLH